MEEGRYHRVLRQTPRRRTHVRESKSEKLTPGATDTGSYLKSLTGSSVGTSDSVLGLTDLRREMDVHRTEVLRFYSVSD